jgi:hypothetical protein
MIQISSEEIEVELALLFSVELLWNRTLFPPGEIDQVNALSRILCGASFTIDIDHTLDFWSMLAFARNRVPSGDHGPIDQ